MLRRTPIALAQESAELAKALAAKRAGGPTKPDAILLLGHGRLNAVSDF